MGVRINVKDVNHWLKDTVFELDLDDILPEESFVGSKILGKLQTRIDTSGWTNEINTPELVKECISMEVAAWRLEIQYGDKREDASLICKMLRAECSKTINDILMGKMDIFGVTDTPTKVGNAEYEFPKIPMFSINDKF